MRKIKFTKSIKVLLAGLLACGTLFAANNIKAGYIYDSDGQPIESSVGLILNNDGIYNVNSTAWGGNVQAEDITSLSDMYVYTDAYGEESIYVVDSKSDKLFIFDENMNYVKTVSEFEIDPSKFTIEELSKIKTKKEDKTAGSASVSAYLAPTNDPSADFWEKYDQNMDPEYEGKKHRFFIKCFNLSGVYRALRPKKDANNVNIPGEYEDLLYLCDKSNAQIVIVDANTFEVVQVVTAPANADFASKFAPLKIVTDSSGRMYIISASVYEGIILMSPKGDFMRYVGVNYTTLSFWDAFMRNFKTEEQLAQETSILSTEFNNLAIDEKGFLYTVSRGIYNASNNTTDYTKMIKRINQAGNDVLIRNGYSVPQGDLVIVKTSDSAAASKFSAITVNEYGVYTVADTTMGRLFTYDNEGNLLYISGGSGLEQTDISAPVAVCYQGENVLVLDSGNCAVLRYEPTDFARSINKATEYQYHGDSVAASNEWSNVIATNPNYQLAYVGVGKTLLENGRYQEAMLYFEKGDDVAYYSRAYKKYRDSIIKEYFPYVMYGGLVLIGGVLVLKVVKKVKNKDGEGDEIV